MARDNVAYKPYIKVNYHDFPGVESFLKQIRAGLEEQAVPFEVAACNEEKGPPGYLASVESPLRVGIGVEAGKKIALFHAQAGDSPLVFMNDADETDARSMGENAGRLVKGMPLVGIRE